jgi:hypothetical protein
MGVHSQSHDPAAFSTRKRPGTHHTGLVWAGTENLCPLLPARFKPWTVQPIESCYGIKISIHCNAASAYLPLISTAEILYSNS